MPSVSPRPLPARLVFLAGAAQGITDAIDSHVQPDCDPGDDDNDGLAGAPVPSRLIAGRFARASGTAWTDEAQARGCRTDLGFYIGVVTGSNPRFQLGNLYSPSLSHGLTCGAACPRMTIERPLVTDVNGRPMARRTVVRPTPVTASWSSPSSLMAPIPRAVAVVSRLVQRPPAAWP